MLRVSLTPQQQRDRLTALRTEMNAVDEVSVPPEAPPPPAPRGKFEDVLEDEIRTLLELDYQQLPANQRHYLIRAAVALWAAKNNRGPVFGGDLDEELPA